MTNLKKNNNKQWNNKTERYKISNTDEMQLRIMNKILYLGTCKMRNETKRNEINRNEIHRNETK